LIGYGASSKGGFLSSNKLRQLYDEDQRDRTLQPIDWGAVSTRDRERRKEVRLLQAIGEIKDGWDNYWAAVVLIHSTDTRDIEDSFELAFKAFSLEPNILQIRAFYALAQDRILLSRGEPQWYGTQKIVTDGQVVLASINPDAVTDEERIAMGILTLEERKREISYLNNVHRVSVERRRRRALAIKEQA
jgi:hypothetical protein